jgi:Ca-activated chloride channel family protein
VSFENPLALLALLLVPLVVAAYVLRERRRGRVTERFASPALLPALAPRPPRRLRLLPLAVLLLALTAIVVGAARPEATISVPREEATVVLALDISRSMAADDVQPSRLAVARAAATSFIGTIPKRFRVGVVAVGTRAVVAAPPTEDRALVTDALNALRPSQGTALGDAVVVAAELGQRERGDDAEVPPTAVLLISDGARDGGETELAEAAERARELGVPVFTLLVGTPDGRIEHPLEGGYTQIVRVPADPAALRELAEGTGGRAFTSPDSADLAAVYANLESRLGRREERRELTDLVAGGALLLLAGGAAASLVLFRRVPA